MGLIQDWVGFEESPDFEIKVNTIIDFWSNPCNAPWTVYVETLYPALGRMLLVLVDTSLLDLLKTYLEPRQGSTRGPRRKKGRRRGGRIGIPDPAVMIAKLIPGRSMWEGMDIGANARFLWQIDGIIDRGLWYWLIVDATTEGFYWWAVGIQEERFCQPTNRPGIFCTNPHPLATAFLGLWYPSTGWNISWKDGTFDYFIASLNTPSGNIAFTYRAKYVNEGNAWGTAGVRLRFAGPDLVKEIVVPPKSEAELVMTGTFKGGPIYALEQRSTGTPFIYGQDGVFFAQKL
jgi:hypothetical protein